MRHRSLLIIGVAAIAASLLVAVGGIAAGRMTGWSIVAPSGMMGRVFNAGSGDIGIDRAVKIAQDVAASYPSGGLASDEVIEFTNNYYASIREKGTGIGAFEILIDRASGQVTREPGPDMMWNTKYGMMRGGLMGGFGVAGTGPTTMTSDKARDIAQGWLDGNESGATANSPDPFYGYYTVDFERGGRLVGMLSVNGYSGQVWYHNWHSSFIQIRDLGA